MGEGYAARTQWSSKIARLSSADPGELGSVKDQGQGSLPGNLMRSNEGATVKDVAGKGSGCDVELDDRESYYLREKECRGNATENIWLGADVSWRDKEEVFQGKGSCPCG